MYQVYISAIVQPCRRYSHVCQSRRVAAIRMMRWRGTALLVSSSILRSTTAPSLYRRIYTSRARTTPLCARPGKSRNPSQMTNIYRIFPQLWSQGGCFQAQTVYAIDRQPPPNTFQTQCSTRQYDDPAYWYEGNTFQRILPPPAGFSQQCCFQSPSWNAVTWRSLPLWLSYVQSVGYTVTTDLSTLSPFTSIYISGP